MPQSKFESRLTELLSDLRTSLLTEFHEILVENGIEDEGLLKGVKSRKVSERTAQFSSSLDPTHLEPISTATSASFKPMSARSSVSRMSELFLGDSPLSPRMSALQGRLAPPSRDMSPRASVESVLCNPHPVALMPMMQRLSGQYLDPSQVTAFGSRNGSMLAEHHLNNKPRRSVLEELTMPKRTESFRANGKQPSEHRLSSYQHEPAAPNTSPPAMPGSDIQCVSEARNLQDGTDSLTLLPDFGPSHSMSSSKGVRIKDESSKPKKPKENNFNLTASNGSQLSHSNGMHLMSERGSTMSVMIQHADADAVNKWDSEHDEEDEEDDNESVEEFGILDVWRSLDRKSMRVTAGGINSQGFNYGLEEDENVGEKTKYTKSCCLETWMSRFTVKQTSPQRIGWDVFGFILIAYDCIYLPLQIFELEETAFLLTMTWTVRFYWTLDFPFSFFTGYDNADCVTEMRPRKIAQRFLKTWLFFDLLIIIFDWLEMAVDGLQNLAAARVGKFGKAVRLIRMARLMRIIRLRRNIVLPEFVKVVSYKVNSEKIGIILAMMRMIVFLCVVTHFIACVWYGIGNSDGTDNWVRRYQVDQERADIGYAYATSFHWSLTQFAGSIDIQPQNSSERFFAVFALVFGFIVAAFVVSSITSSMTRLQIVMARHSTQVSMLNRYLYDNGISTKLALRVQRNAQYAFMQEARNTPEKDIELLQLVSEPLRVELHYEIHSPVLTWHPFFRHYSASSPAALRRICHLALDKLMLFPGDVLFSTGEMSHYPRMYFCLSGRLDYLHENPLRSGPMPYSTWACEAVLWTHWAHHGTLRAKTEISLATLDAKLFQDIVLQFQSQANQAKRYADRFVALLNGCNKDELTDLRDVNVDWEEVCEEVFSYSDYVGRFASLRSRSDTSSLQRAPQEPDRVVTSPKRESTSPKRLSDTWKASGSARSAFAKVFHIFDSSAVKSVVHNTNSGSQSDRLTSEGRISQVLPSESADTRHDRGPSQSSKVERETGCHPSIDAANLP